MLFPPRVKDFVPDGHLSHFVCDVVEQELDLRDIENDYIETRGAPPYSPRLLVAILLYGYCRGVYSSRKLSQACVERMDFVAICGQERPDFRTISDFRKRHLGALGNLFVQILHLCEKAGLVKLGHVAVDGTKIRANASKGKNKRYKDIKKEIGEIEKHVKEWFRQAEDIDEAEDQEYGEDKRGDELPAWVSNPEERRKRLAEAKKALEEEKKNKNDERKKATESGEKPRSHQKVSNEPSPDQRYNFTDPDSRVMKTHGAFEQCYNAQCAVDASSQVIVACTVVNDPGDHDQLLDVVEQVRENMSRCPREVSADTGYCSDRNITELEELGIRGYIATGRKRAVLPGTPTHAMRLRLKRAGKRTRYRFRCQTVEPTFGIIKCARGFLAFLLRGKAAVGDEWRLVCAAANLFKLKAARA